MLDEHPRRFTTQAEAEVVCNRLNEDPPEWGWSPWYLGQDEDGSSVVIRARGVIAEDLDQPVSEYEEMLRGALENTLRESGLVEVQIEEVKLQGSYPNTDLVVLFRAIERKGYGSANPRCQFGVHWGPIWPAGSVNPESEADYQDVSFMEWLDTSLKARDAVLGLRPCDPESIIWLN